MVTGKTVAAIQPSGYKSIEINGSFMKNLFQNGITLMPKGKELLASFNYNFNLFDSTLESTWQDNPSFEPYKVKNVLIQPDGNLLVTLKNLSNSGNAVTLIDSSGKKLWKEPYIIKGAITKYVEFTSKGLVYVTNEIADVVDWNTGKSRLINPINFENSDYIMATHSKEKKCFAFYINNKLYELNYETAKTRQLLKKIDFKGDDVDKVPNFLEARQDGYFLTAPQNILLVGYDGNIKYQKYYKRPGMSDNMRRLIAGVGGFVMGYAFNDQAQQATNFMYNTGMTDIQNYAVVAGLDHVYGGTGSALMMSGVSTRAFARTKIRDQLLQSKRDYQLMLTKLETGGNGFIEIDKDSGKELKSIRLDDKEPTIKIDDAIAGMYYISKDDKTISFYSLPDNK